MKRDEQIDYSLATSDVMRHRVLRARDAAEFCAISISHLRRLHARGLLPPPIKLGERRLGWRLCDLIAWLESRRGFS